MYIFIIIKKEKVRLHTNLLNKTNNFSSKIIFFFSFSRISTLIRRVKGDKDLSYETIWSNGSRTFTVVSVRRVKKEDVVTNKKIKSKQKIDFPNSGLHREKRYCQKYINKSLY